MRSTEDRAANLHSGPIVCPPSRRFDILTVPIVVAASVLQLEQIENALMSNEDVSSADDEGVASLSLKRPRSSGGKCSLAEIFDKKRE